MHPNYADGVNVADQLDDAGSLLRFYRRLIRVRRRHAPLSRGDCTLLETGDADVLAYVRAADGASCVVVLNMSGRERSVRLDLPGRTLRLLCGSHRRPADRGPGAELRLAAHEAYVAAVEPTALDPLRDWYFIGSYRPRSDDGAEGGSQGERRMDPATAGRERPGSRADRAPLRVGVIGCGLIAQVMHLPYLRELSDRSRVVAICDLSPASSRGRRANGTASRHV